MKDGADPRVNWRLIRHGSGTGTLSSLENGVARTKLMRLEPGQVLSLHPNIESTRAKAREVLRENKKWVLLIVDQADVVHETVLDQAVQQSIHNRNERCALFLKIALAALAWIGLAKALQTIGITFSSAGGILTLGITGLVLLFLAGFFNLFEFLIQLLILTVLASMGISTVQSLQKKAHKIRSEQASPAEAGGFMNKGETPGNRINF